MPSTGTKPTTLQLLDWHSHQLTFTFRNNLNPKFTSLPPSVHCNFLQNKQVLLKINAEVKNYAAAQISQSCN